MGVKREQLHFRLFRGAREIGQCDILLLGQKGQIVAPGHSACSDDGNLQHEPSFLPDCDEDISHLLFTYGKILPNSATALTEAAQRIPLRRYVRK